jgi:hypothetical protein
MPHKLTAKVADPLTGQQNSYIGWHFVMAEALDVLSSWIWIKTQTTWSYNVFPNPDDPYLIRMSLVGSVGNVIDENGNPQQMMAQYIVNDTDYYVYDSGHIKVMSQDEAEADYDIAPYTLPTPPPPVAEPPQPAVGMPVQVVPPPREGDPVPGAQM